VTVPSPAPAEGPATASDVAARLGGVAEGDVAGAVAAVNAMCVGRWGISPTTAGEWRRDHVEGANMLAVRLYNRRNSPAGVAAFGAEGAAYVTRNDPDVALLLQIGAYARPQVG
jgi:hypothetical protein